MKPSSFILALLCASSMLLCSCEPNDPETKKGGDDTASLHQPADPATWSPVGKRYVADISGEDKNPYGYEQFWHVVHFFSRDSAYSYATIHDDLTPMPDMPFNTYSSYKMSYPKVITTVGIDKSEALFTDTLTLIGSSIHYLKQD